MRRRGCRIGLVSTHHKLGVSLGLLLQDVLALQPAGCGGESTGGNSGRHGFCWGVAVTGEGEGVIGL